MQAAVVLPPLCVDFVRAVLSLPQDLLNKAATVIFIEKTMSNGGYKNLNPDGTLAGVVTCNS